MSSHALALSDALTQLAGVPRLLVALDFDGTLAPTVDHPDDARASDGVNEAISQLVSAPGTWVALVSGRALGSLINVAHAPAEIALVGSHGAEFRIDGSDTMAALAEDEREVHDKLCAAIADIAARYDGAMAENKPAGCALHTRLSSRDDALAAEAEALSVIQSMTGGELISHRRGKDILEFTVRHADKGTAVATLRKHFAADAVLFIGDDVTDEDAFLVLRDGDVGVKVGDGATAARHRIADPDAVKDLLTTFADVRAGAQLP